MNEDRHPAALGAAEAARAIAEGRLKSVELVAACLERIDQLEETVGAWQFLDRDHALAQAEACDDAHRSGVVTGPLHGVPVGVKDIFDTADMPTENGSPLHAGRRPLDDATVVARLRAAGAVVMGKTVTTEFAVYHPGKTRNPHDPARTPGGSSSGSAAAVAAAMMPLAIGTQTNGSVIRPAAFCGVFGYKPTFGTIPRTGVLALSRDLDQVGVFARSLGDAALTAETLMTFDPADPDTRPRAHPGLTRVMAEEPPLPPVIGFVKTAVWERAEADTREGFAEIVEALGGRVTELTLPSAFDEALEVHRRIMEPDLADALGHEFETGRERLSPRLVAMIESGLGATAVDYKRARARAAAYGEAIAQVFETCDAVLTPAVPGEAPLGLEATGDPAFCTLWTLTGLPALSLPLLRGASGMPIGVQLVGARGDDARLFRTARWLLGQLDADGGDEG